MKGDILFMQKNFANQKLAFSALCIALYIIVMAATQSFAFGQYQIRIATALYGLSAIFPFLIVPFTLANILSNVLMGGLGLPDIIGGGLVGFLTTTVIVMAKKYGCGNWIVWLAVTFVPGLLVPVWLSIILDIPYILLASTLLVGQCICGIAGLMLVSALERVGAAKIFAFEGGKR